MLKFDRQVVDTIETLKELTSLIGDILRSETIDQDKKTKKLSALYKNRKSSIDDLQTWYSIEGNKSFVEENPKEWDKLINPIILADKRNLNILEDDVKTLSSKLRDTRKNKNLLIYSRENQK